MLGIILALFIFYGKRRISLKKIDRMSGHDFEDFLEKGFRRLGFEVTRMPKSRDFGADLILEKNGERTVVQAKRYDDKVSIAAVQQVFSAMYYYDADKSIVVTNNYYTEPCKKFAKKLDVELWDRDDVIEIFDL